MDLILKHVVNSFVNLIKHPSQGFLRLVPLLTLLVELFVEFTYFFVEHVHQNLTSILSLFVFFEDRSVYLVDLLSKGVLIPILAFLSCLLFFC